MTLLMLRCGACGSVQVEAVEGVCLQRGKQRLCLRGDGPTDWPEARCAHCESSDLYLVEDLR